MIEHYSLASLYFLVILVKIIKVSFKIYVFVQVAEILVKAFPNREDVRVPLRDKYNGLHQRLRHCVVKGNMCDTKRNLMWIDLSLAFSKK